MDKAYPIDYSKPGTVIIFNNKNFSHPNYRDRDGSEQDVRELCNVFRNLKYNVPSPYINQTESQMRSAINQYVNTDYSSYGSLLIFIMSHGSNTKIISSDCKEIDLNEFINPLKKNFTLTEKPKLFFIQACRGSKKMKSSEADIETDDAENILSKYYDDERRPPREADFLFSYSTVEDFLSLRDPDDGSWFIQILCKAINEGDNKDIYHILTFVHGEVSKMVGLIKNIRVKMMPTFESRLTKLFYIREPLKEKKVSFYYLF